MINILVDKAEVGFEPTIKVLQTSALPLGYTAICYQIIQNWDSWIRTSACQSQSLMPYHLAISQYQGGIWDSNPCMPDPQTGVLTPSPIPPFKVTGIVGIEPTLAVLETDVLPLYDIPIMEEGGFEPPNSERAVLQTAAFSHFATPPA